MTTAERRTALLKWLTALPDREGMTAPEIAREAVAWNPTNPRCIYSTWDSAGVHQCLEDLIALARDDKLVRRGRIPATWWTQ